MDGRMNWKGRRAGIRDEITREGRECLGKEGREGSEAGECGSRDEMEREKSEWVRKGQRRGERRVGDELA